MIRIQSKNKVAPALKHGESIYYDLFGKPV